MDKRLFFKLAAIALMALLLLIPLAMVEDQIRARSVQQQEVQHHIANGAAGEQVMVGPVLAIQFRELVTLDADGASATPRRQFVDKTVLIPPAEWQLAGDSHVETRQRGIYQARLFRLAAESSGHFVLKPLIEAGSGRQIVDVRASLRLGITDPRGVGSDPKVVVNGQSYRFAAISASENTAAPCRLAVDLGAIDPQRSHRFDFSFPLQLTGTTRLAIAPSGDANRISLKADWPHPNFGGRFLPIRRTVDGKGFEAHWEISHLARNFEATQAPRTNEVLSIDFIDPVNIYLQAERAVKYGFLFVFLTFAGFFLTEILRRAPIHPLQYLLVGLALAIFFLLLIALSEHLPFAIAYGLSASACIGLISYYLAGALGGWQRGVGFGAGLTGLYGVLYGVLLSEDNALLMGSLLLFLALAAVMLTTRRLNWYELGHRMAGGDA